MSDRLTYLASPYASADPEIRAAREAAVCREAARLLRAGRLVYSPIAHGRALERETALPSSWSAWQRHCRRMIEAADDLSVLMLDGWRTSLGVQAEIRIARDLGRPIHLRYPRATCPRCGRALAQTTRGVWRHRCQGLLPTMEPYDRATAVA